MDDGLNREKEGGRRLPRLLIATGLFPPDHGGPATYVPAMASALSQRFQIVAVVTLSERLDHDDSAYEFPVIRLPRGLTKLFRIPRSIALLWRLSAKADIVYLNGMFLDGIVGCKLLRRRRVVVKVVGDRIWEMARNAGATDATIDQFQSHPGQLKWRLLQRLQSWYLSKADRIITPSQYLANLVAGWIRNPERIECVFNAVNIASLPDTVADNTKGR